MEWSTQQGEGDKDQIVSHNLFISSWSKPSTYEQVMTCKVRRADVTLRCCAKRDMLESILVVVAVEEIMMDGNGNVSRLHYCCHCKPGKQSRF